MGFFFAKRAILTRRAEVTEEPASGATDVHCVLRSGVDLQFGRGGGSPKVG